MYFFLKVNVNISTIMDHACSPHFSELGMKTGPLILIAQRTRTDLLKEKSYGDMGQIVGPISRLHWFVSKGFHT